ncbi:MAG: hypothetical protein WC227_02615 [Patescibacteria group bacterium]|jgi:hypothetical protein
MIRLFLILGAVVLLTFSGLSQDPGNSTVPDGQTLTSQFRPTVKTPVQRVAQKRPLTAADLAGIESYRAYWQKRGLSMTPSVKSALEYMLQMDIIHLPIYLQRTPQEYDFEAQSIEKMLNRVDWYVNVPVSQTPAPIVIREQASLPSLPALKPVEIVKLASVPMPTPVVTAPVQVVQQVPVVKEIVTNYYTTTTNNTETYVQQPAGYQARFPYQQQGPSFQGSLYVGWTRQQIPATTPTTPPTGPCDPLGGPNTEPPPGATNAPIGPVSGPTIVCPLPPGQGIPSNVPQTQPGFIPGGVGAGGSPSTTP